MMQKTPWLPQLIVAAVAAGCVPAAEAQKTTTPSIYETLDNFNGAFSELKEERDALRQEIENMKREQRSLIDGVKARLEASEEDRDRSTDALLDARTKAATLAGEKEKLAGALELQEERKRRFEAALAIKDGAIKDAEAEKEKLEATLASAKKAYAGSAAQLEKLREEAASWKDLADKFKTSGQKAALLEQELGVVREKLKFAEEKTALAEKSKEETYQRMKDELEQLRAMQGPLKAKIEMLEKTREEEGKRYREEREGAQAASLVLQKQVLDLQTKNSMLESSLVPLGTKAETAAARVLELEKERATVQQQQASLEKELVVFREANESLAGAKAEFEKQLTQARQAKAGLEKDLNVLQQQMESSEKESAALQQDQQVLSGAKAELEKQLARALADKAGLEKEKSETQKELVSLDEEADALAKDNETLADARAELEKQLVKALADKAGLEKEKKTLLKALEQANQVLGEAEKKAADAEKAKKEIEADLKTAQKEKADLLVGMKKKQSDATKDLRRDNLELKTTVDKLEKTLSQKSAMLEGTEKEGKVLGEEVKGAQEALVSLKKDHEAYVKQLQDEFADALKVIREQLEGARKELGETKKTQAALSDAQAELKKLDEEKAGLREKIDAFNDELFKNNVAMAQSATTEKENRLLKTNMGDLLEKYNKMNTQYKELNRRYEELKEERDALKESQSSAVSSLAETEGLRNENQSLHGRLVSSEEKLRNLLNRLVDLQSENQALSEKTHTQVSPKDFRETKSSNKQLEEENSGLKKRLIQLEHALEEARTSGKELAGLSQKQQAKITRMDAKLGVWENEREGWTRQEKKTKEALGTKGEKIDDLREVLAVTEEENRKIQAKVDDFAGQHAALNTKREELEKENALLHYNLGVIYTDKAMYDQAIKEFKKTLEHNPADLYAAYNLGIIYSQYVLDENQAVTYFKLYLKTAPNDKDANRARKYIMTRDSYDIDSKI